MARQNSLTRPDTRMRAGLFGNPADLSNEELDFLYEAICPGEDPTEELRSLSDAAPAAQRMDCPLPPHLKSCRSQIEGKPAAKKEALAASAKAAESARIPGVFAGDGTAATSSDGPTASPIPGAVPAVSEAPPALKKSTARPRSDDDREPAIVFASRLADVLLDVFHVSGKTDVDELCRRLGFRPHGGRFPHFDEIRATEPPSDIDLLKTRTMWPEARERFTIAHEIGHLILPYHRKPAVTCDPSVIECFSMNLRTAERAANEFATELLLPRRSVEDRFHLPNPSLAAINAVAQDYETSLVVATASFLNVTRESCAMVLSRHGHALWSRSSRSMPFEPSLNNSPVAASVAGRIFAGKLVHSGMEKVDARLWLGDQATKVRTLFEESVRLREPDTVLTLLWAPAQDARISQPGERYRQSA